MAEQAAEDARSLLDTAVDAHTDLSKLATGLAHAGANPQAVGQLQKIVEIVGGIVKVLGAGPTGAAPAQPGAPGEEAPPAPGGPPQAAAGPPQAAAGPPQGPTPGARPNGFHEASANLQAALASKHAAAQRALSGQ